MRLFRYPKALIVVVLLPLLIAGVGMWALKDRVDRLDDVPAAVVNLDEGATMTVDGKEQLVPFGRQLAGALTQPGTTQQGDASTTVGFDWRLTDEKDAQEGLKNGEYAAVIVIPKDFSTKLATLGTTDAEQADIQVTTNDASGALDSAIGIAISQAAAASTGTEMTRQYLSQLYVGFNTMKDSFTQAADGAEGIDDGVTGLDDGLGQTSEGARQLADGSSGLAGGAQDLSDGMNGLDSGIQQTATGTRSLADGLGDLSTGVDGVAQGSRDLADGLGDLADGADQLSDGAQQLSDGINGTDQQPGLIAGVDQLDAGVTGDGTAQNPGLAAGAQQLADGAQASADGLELAFDGDGTEKNPGLVDGSKHLANGLEKASTGVSAISAGDASDPTKPGLSALAAECAEKSTDTTFCAQLQGYADGLAQASQGLDDSSDGARTLAEGVDTAAHGDGTSANPGLVGGSEQLATGAQQFAAQAPTLVDGVQQLSDGVHQLGDGASGLATGADQLASGTRQSADGADQLADGAEQLSTGAEGAATGASQLADGTDQLATGSSQLASGTSELADGADELATGTQGLADGTSQLHDGSTQLADGSGQFAEGLRDGADQMPSYTESERTAMSDMGAQPVTSLSSRENQAHGASTATFPFVVALALWLGAFGSFLLLPALSRRFLDAAMPMWMVALRSLLPALALGVVQTVAVLGVITAIGVKPVSALGVGVISLAGAVAFAALHQALLALLGNRVGRIASIVVMVLQVVVLAGILPLQTAPELLQSISAFMPISIVSTGLIHAALGGTLVSTSSTLLALAGWTAASIIVTLVASRSARSLAVARLVSENDALPA
ncbi:YhgE/Pip domain-containing protein [Brachybacterium huguangmaarense]|uniref:YhgE/Pip domain-containing protein n=1 Tax=Brachybacterium huguangmaarense TaxID=1652028 RepID=A0ABY6G0Z5_9MICO|nr:YhgE/Pip domain-containing protein [Brachybacterium huguangmaarense]UYG16348.1 YhgE/Pip domain-containing protein [Brachybacterium huguangmaarense]